MSFCRKLCSTTSAYVLIKAFETIVLTRLHSKSTWQHMRCLVLQIVTSHSSQFTATVALMLSELVMLWLCSARYGLCQLKT